jgi:hypothetical protein
MADAEYVDSGERYPTILLQEMPVVDRRSDYT